MKLDLFSEKDKVLLLGEGNFSFSVDLYKHKLPIEIVPTCFEKEISYQLQEENIKFLLSHNVSVLFNVDATKLHENPKVLERNFNKIVFNFPHVGGKMKIHLNRILIKSFFESASKILEEDGQVLLSLCGGQGGTPADHPLRTWADSWQVTEMAAHGNFILTAVEPFEKENFPKYSCIGYRGQDTKFNLKGALVHVFSKSKPPFECIDERTPENRLKAFALDETSTVKSNIVHYELFKSNPFLNSESAVSFLKNILMESLTDTMRVIKTLSDDVVPLYVQDKSGVAYQVKNVEHTFSLRSCPLQTLKTILTSTNHFSFSSQIICHSGLYFHPKFSNNFLKNPPVSLNILVLGCDIVNFVENYLTNLVKIFKRKETVIKTVVNLIEAGTKPGDSSCLDTLATKFMIEDTKKCLEACVVYSLTWFGGKAEACIIHADSIASYFFQVTNWREIWDAKSKVLIESNEIPVLRRSLLYPNSYDFDITLRYATEEGFSEEKFIQVLWMAGGMIIENVVLTNHYDSGKEWSSKCYRITYRCLDKPLYRSKAIEIHMKVVGKMLEKELNVVIA